MPYKPKFCCQCGEKIERVKWTFRASRRFCELCETELGIYDWLPRVALIGGISLAMFGFGSFWMRPSKPLNVTPNQLISSSQNVNKETVKLSNTNSQPLPPKSVGNQQPPVPQQNLTPKPATVLSSPEQPQETVYFCGAPTKKGTPCSRRVKGGGRCWQHIGQAAMLPDKKLVANQ